MVSMAYYVLSVIISTVYTGGYDYIDPRMLTEAPHWLQSNLKVLSGMVQMVAPYYSKTY